MQHILFPACLKDCVIFTVVKAKLRFFRGFPDGIQYDRHRPKLLLCLLFSADQCLSPGRHRHPDLGVSAGLPREPVCGLDGALPGEEALRDLFAGAESGSGGRFRAAQCPLSPALPGWRPGLGVWHGSMQAAALPVKREHVRVHLPHLPDEHGPLVGRNEAFSVPENENQALPAGSPAGGLGVGVHPVGADAFLPQVRQTYVISLDLLHFLNLQNECLMAAAWCVSHERN